MSGGGSQFPLVRLAAKYREMTKDGRLLSNRAALSVIQLRMEQLLERIDMNQAPDRLGRLQKLWEKFREEERKGNSVDAAVVKGEIDAEFEAAFHDYAAWKEMYEAVDLHRKLTETEVKIAKDLQAIMTAEQIYELTAKLLGEIIAAVNGLENVDAPTKARMLKRIQYGFTRVVGDGARDAVDANFVESDDDEDR